MKEKKRDKKGEESKVKAEEGYCPNCWGYQQYQGEMHDAAKNAGVDLSHHEKSVGWIRAYAEKNFEGIKLDKVNGKDSCPACVSESKKK